MLPRDIFQFNVKDFIILWILLVCFKGGHGLATFFTMGGLLSVCASPCSRSKLFVLHDLCIGGTSLHLVGFGATHLQSLRSSICAYALIFVVQCFLCLFLVFSLFQSWLPRLLPSNVCELMINRGVQRGFCNAYVSVSFVDFCSTACMGVNSACKIIVLWPIFPKIGKKYCVW